jgi:AcrR family transcriptional regulator
MPSAKKDGPYHHGQLRDALLDAALRLARERGLQGVTLREVARTAGVSHAAPYHHFADKAELVTALAVAGFERLAAVLRAAVAAAPADDLARLHAAGVAYVGFAQREPAAFRIMFRPELRQTETGSFSTDIDAAGRRAYQVLRDEIARGQLAGLVRPDHLDALALTAWSTMHGLATLLIDGAPGWTGSDGGASSDRTDVAARVAALVIEGLRVRAR